MPTPTSPEVTETTGEPTLRLETTENHHPTTDLREAGRKPKHHRKGEKKAGEEETPVAPGDPKSGGPQAYL